MVRSFLIMAPDNPAMYFLTEILHSVAFSVDLNVSVRRMVP